MKKLFFTLCALCISTAMWATPVSNDYWVDDSRPTNADEIYQDATSGLYFYVNASGNAVITYINDSYDKTSSTSLDKSSWTSGYENSGLTSLVIPEYVSDSTGNQYPVTMIGRLAFFKATNFTGSLTIPSYITELGSNAFEDCSNITEVIIEYSDTALKDDANQLYGSSFWNCTSIITVTLNRNVTAGRENDNYFVTPFNQLTGITKLTVGEHVTSIPIYMFYKCSNLALVYSYSATVPSLGKDAFLQIASGAVLHVCESLLNEYKSSDWATYFSTINNDLSDPGLEEGTYKDLTTGLYFEINEDGTTASIYHDELGVYTDDNLVAHATITGAYTLPEQVSADGNTYYDVTRVEESAFENSSISGHLVIPAYITAVGASAFRSCTQITEVTYEYSATALSDESGGNNDNTESFRYCTGITKVNIYRDINIGSSGRICAPFAWQTAITTVNIGPRVTKLPNYMFRQTSNNTIATINCYGAVPPTLGTAVFDNLDSTYTINVPQGAEEAYASSWSSYYTEGHKGTLDNAYAVGITYSDGEEYYATYYNSKGVDIYPQGGTTNAVTTYAIPSVTKEDDAAYVNLTEVGATVPAGTAVLVEANAEATYTVIETTAAKDASYTSGNCLYGLDEAGTVTGEEGYYYYILTYPADENNGTALGFYWATEDGSASSYTFAAHKAYLKLETTALDGVKSVALRKGEGDTTGITTIEENTAATTSTGIYTVQGVRVSNMNKQGLYIVDGKKVLVK